MVARARAVAPSGRDASLVFGIFLLAQVLDGLLTYAGLSLLGTQVEANVLLTTWMDLIGTPATIVGAKVLACACGYVLYYTAWHRPLAITAGLYIGVAVIPWCAVLADALLLR
jgi:hypothetical protein